MSDQVFPFLMFDGRAEEALRFYVSLFPESRIVELVRYGKGARGARAASAAGSSRLPGRPSCARQVIMPLDDYGFSRQFAWVSDRFGRLLAVEYGLSDALPEYVEPAYTGTNPESPSH